MKKILTWNCNMAFRKKFEKIFFLEPDLLVVQEHEQFEKIPLLKNPTAKLSFGKNPNKSIAVYSFCEYTFKININYNQKYKYVIPIDVFIENDKQFTLIIVWAMENKENWNQRYIGQVYFALREYYNLLNEKTIIVGDFNWNVIWDKNKKEANLNETREILSKKRIFSLYHCFFNEDFGIETLPTLFLQKKISKKYHIDYCFAGEYWKNKLKNVYVGEYEDWIQLSDHMPLLFTFADP